MPTGHQHSNKHFKRRCQVHKCTKLAEDCYEGKYLCRLHSPVREAYKKALKEEKKKLWQA